MKTEEILARNKEKKDAPMAVLLDFEKEIFDEFYKFFIAEDVYQMCLKAPCDALEKRYAIEGSLDAHDSIRQRVKDMLDVFIASHGYSAECTSNRLDMFLNAASSYRPFPRIGIQNASIFSWLGSINEKRKWINKITVSGDGRVINHIARTDAAFLGEHKASDFAEFVSKLNIRLKNTLQFAWKDFVVNQRKDNDESQWQ